MQMKRLIIYIVILAFAFSLVPQAQAVPQAKSREQFESITYDVYFHLGFIWAKAGRGTLSLANETEADGTQRVHGQLAAKSLSIVEHLMKVRDTLDTWMTPGYIPREFIKKTHEGKYNCTEHNIFQPTWKDASSDQTPSNVKSSKVKVHRWRKNGSDPATETDTIHTVAEPAYDMLSLFYAMRRLNFATMKKGESIKFATFPGLKKEWYKVEFNGREKISLRNGKKFDTYCVLLTVATKDQEKTPIKAWLTTTSDHKPLKVTIGLARIGSIQAEIVE